MKKILQLSILGIFLIGFGLQAQAEVIWQENFDNQDNWELEQSTSDVVISSWQGENNIPPNFNFIRIAPSVYDENNQHNSMIIDSSNHRGIAGKGLTFWVESGDQSCGSGAHWCSDSLLGVNLTDATATDGVTRDGYEEIWVKLYIKFDSEWDMKVTRNTFPMHKFFRTEWWSGEFAPWSYFNGSSRWSPAVIFDIMRMNNGQGNIGWKDIYRYDNEVTPPWDPPHVEFEDGYTLDGNYGGTGVPFNSPGNIGDNNWHEMIYHIKLNSVIGAEDGIVQSWFDGSELSSTTDLAFGDIGAPPAPNRRKWNVFIFGGNDFNEFDPVFENYSEQWWAIDDIVIATTEADLNDGDTSIHADVDQNSIINSTDAFLVLRDFLGLNMTSTNWQTSSMTGDANCDGILNFVDISLILRDSLGLDVNEMEWCAS